MNPATSTATLPAEFPFAVIWHGPDHDEQVTVIGELGLGSDLRSYIRTAHTQTGLPVGEMECLDAAGALWLAQSYVRAGLCVLPIRTDGSKKVALTRWEPFEHRPPTAQELRQWFAAELRGLAIVCGKVSGNLEAVDVDDVKLVAPYFALIEECAPGLLARLIIAETPRGGRHLIYRCAEIAGNQKLALRPSANDPRKADTLIETRGEGGYIVAPGSPAACHPTGRTYRLLQGSFDAIPTITPDERAILRDCARSLNEHIKPSQQKSEPTLNNGLKPGDEFNRRGDVRALLEKYGWRQRGRSHAGERWIRPDGDRPSATLFSESGKFYVFSTNAAPLEFDRAYSPFSLLAQLEHGGDFKAAAKALAAQGYGTPAKPQKAEQPKNGAAAVKEVGSITFEVNEKGVWATDENGSNTWVCSQLIIEADTRDERNVNWGRLLKFPDRDGVWHTWSMPMSLLSRDGGEYREHLLNLGLDIGGRKSRALLESYLNVKPDKRALCVTKQGWRRNVFVLPDEFIGGADAEPIYLQTFTDNHLFRQSGTAEEWRDRLGVFCAGNSRLVLAVAVAFCAPLLEPLQGENGGWHFTGGTSVGKSTALYVAGSVQGGGGDKGFLRRWRATINGLESVAEAHHDALLCLDEIAECKPDDVNEAA